MARFTMIPPVTVVQVRDGRVLHTRQTADETAHPIDYLRGVADSARHAVSLTKAGRADEAAEHVDAIERLTAAYRDAVTGQGSPHFCDNCDGIDPETCLANEGRDA